VQTLGKTRRGVLGAGAGLAGAVLAACAPGAGGGGAGETQSSKRTQPITMSFMSWRPNAMDRFEKKWKEWAEPRKITIEIEKVANSTDRNTQLTTRLAADQAPDATDSHSDADFPRCEQGHFKVLDQLMARDKVTQDKGYGLTYAEKWRGKTYQLSYWVEPFGIYYNKTIFQKKGIPEPWGGKALDAAGMTPFAYGKVAIHYRSVNDWSRMFPVVKDQFQWDMMPLPTMGGKAGASWTAGHPVNMWNKTKNPDDVWEFLKFLIGDDFQKFMSQEQVLVPAKVDHQANFYRAPSVQPHQHAKVFTDVFKKPHGIAWRNFKSAENGTVYNEFRNKIYSGELGLTNGLKEASARLNLDNEWGGGENPFKGLKLPIAPK